MYVDGHRTDLERWKVIVEQEQVALTLYGSRQQDIEREVRAGRPVYLTVHPNDTETLGALANEFRLVRVGELWRVLNLPPRAPATSQKMRAKFADQSGHELELLEYAVYPETALGAGDFGLLTLFWRAPASVNRRLTISLRVIDAQDRVVYQRDSEPASGLRPVIGWAPGEIVQDDLGFFVPPPSAPGVYRFEIVVYDPASGAEWQVAGQAAYRLEAEIVVK
jgi:hypothetical protein